MSIYQIFIFMFYALDAVYDEVPNETLGNYLSGLNPFLFNDEGSADPAEFEQFKTAYNEIFNGTTQDAGMLYDFCKAYLVKNAPSEVIKAFGQVEKEEWIELFEKTIK